MTLIASPLNHAPYAYSPSLVPPSLCRVPALLVVLATLLQLTGWLAWLPVGRGEPGKTAFAVAEMGLLALLLGNGWRIRQWLRTQPDTSRHQLPVQVATLTLSALALCTLGDAVNRNFSQSYFAYDTVVEHSYLADSVWFFLPGYALFIRAAWRATRGRIPRWLPGASLALAALAGAASFAGLYLPGTSPYVLTMTGSYAVLITLMVPAGLWIALAFGRPAWPVAAGAVLATVADALIGQFWLYGHGFYPAIAYLNFIVYFLSQALVQQLPLVLFRRLTGPGSV